MTSLPEIYLSSYSRTVMRGIPHAITLMDDIGTIVCATIEFERLFGYHLVDELKGKSIDELLAPEVRSKHRGHRQRFNLDPTIRAMGLALETRGYRRDGSNFPAAVTLVPFAEDGNSFICVMVVETVSMTSLSGILKRGDT